MRVLDPARLTFGYLLPTREAVLADRPQAAPLIALGEQAEALGFDAVWAGDGPLARARHDALMILSAVAARTERPVIGTAVLVAALRPALLLAQAAATLDQVSAGRLVLGVGAGFPYPETERQFEAFGVPYSKRVRRMEETIAAMRTLWADPGRAVDHHGSEIELNGVALEPAPRRPGGPPVWLAGAGEEAERRVGRIADGWLPYPPSAALYSEGLARVRAASAEAGRRRAPQAGLYVTVAFDRSEEVAQRRLQTMVERYYEQPLELVGMIQAMYAGSPEGLIGWLDPYVRAGARHIVLRVCDEEPERGLRSAGDAKEAVSKALDDLVEAPT